MILMPHKGIVHAARVLPAMVEIHVASCRLVVGVSVMTTRHTLKPK